MMREATKEERESIDNHIDSISNPTGTNFYDTYGDQDAEWIPHSLGFYKCSNCSSIWSYNIAENIFTNFCPRCGKRIKHLNESHNNKTVTAKKKTFEEVQKEMDDMSDCLVRTEEFLRWIDDGFVNYYDGYGIVHNGESFIKSNTNIFCFIDRALSNITKEEFIEKYPYVAWYNK